VVLPVVQGAFGEDGTVQGFLEMAGLPYVGSGVFASSAALDKEFSRKLFVIAGLTVAPHVVLRPGQTLEEADRGRLNLPVRVVGCRSSEQPTLVRDWSALPAALEDAFAVDDKVLVESAVEGDRHAVAVLHTGDQPVEVAGPSELAETAKRAFAALDCTGLAIVELIRAGETVYVESVNTSPEPNFPGIEQADLVRRLIETALKQGTKLR
jgi:D-alanine-D-alanine ligase